MSIENLERFTKVRWTHAYARENYARYAYYYLSERAKGRVGDRLATIADPTRIETTVETMPAKDGQRLGATIMRALRVEGEIQLLKEERPDPKVIEFYKGILRGFWAEDERHGGPL